MKLIEEGRDPPPVFFEQPDIPGWQQFYWVAFSELSTERQIGMGLGPIPILPILAYAESNKLSRDETTSFVEIIRSVDSEFLAMSTKTITKRRGKGGKEEQEAEEVSVTDVKGVREVMDRLKARASAAAKKKLTTKGKDSGNT